MDYGKIWGGAHLKRQADNDNRRRRTRADEQYDVMVIMLGLSALFIAAMWAQQIDSTCQVIFVHKECLVETNRRAIVRYM
jgi:hypothetical protein